MNILFVKELICLKEGFFLLFIENAKLYLSKIQLFSGFFLQILSVFSFNVYFHEYFICQRINLL